MERGALKYHTVSRRLTNLKNHKRREQDFLIKMRKSIQGVSYRREDGGKGCKHCFSLMMYEFFSNNVLCSASISFTMYIFLKIL